MTKFLKFLFFTALFLFFLKPVCFAGVEPYTNFIKGKIKRKDTIIVKDEKFRNAKYNWEDITNISVKDVVSFRLIDEALLTKKFSAKIYLKVESLTYPGQQAPSVKTVELSVNYNVKKGLNYKINDSYDFKGAYWIRVTVDNIYSPEFLNDLPPNFQLSANIIIDRKYKFKPDTKIGPAGVMMKGAAKSASASPAPAAKASTFSLASVKSFAALNSSAGTSINSGNQLQLTWPVVTGAEEYDIEWTTADSGNPNITTIQQMAAGSAGTVDPVILNGIFLHNATRITTNNQSYLLSLPYNDDYILLRMRQVQYSTDGVRQLGNWDYQLGSGQYVVYALSWYQSNLNWQYSAAFAEEGKKKEVVSYFDGSLRSRQTVTINNSDNVALVQENLYDEFGRATASILPAPFKEASGVTPYLRYFTNYNRNAGNTPYTIANVVGSVPSASCEYNPDSLNVTAGASQYYSASNPFKNDKTYNPFIPDAQGFPISVTEYTGDNTGRIKVQGGVGKTFQPGKTYPSKTTKYFYAKPGQWELDRIFGNDVGTASHYLKNMTVDANNQISISYVNASGKTIATALSGNVPANMDSISTILPAVIEKVDLLDSAQFVFDSSALQIKGSTTYLVSQSGPAKLAFNIKKLIDQYPGGANAICSNCYYDLTIKVLNDCNTPIYTTTTPIQVGSVLSNCAATGIQTDSLTVTFPQIGEYYFTYQLAFSKTVMENYVNNFVTQGLQNGALNNNFSFILPYLKGLNYKSCLSDCSTCEQSLGSQAGFTQAFQNKLLGLGVDSASVHGSIFQTWVSGEYSTLKTYCDSLSATCSQLPADSVSNCSQYETPMLADVSPGGQYALFDSAYNPIEPQLNVISNNWRTEFPVQAATTVQYQSELITLPDGSITSPYDQSFTLAMFVQYFKPDWASKFLKYHPEFCKLQFCYINNASETWDQNVQDNINQAAAIPTIPGAPAGLQYNYTNAGWLVAADPFFQSGGLGASYASAMQNDLQNYSQNVLNITTASTKSLSGFVDFLTYCSDQGANTNTLVTSFNNWDNCAPVTTCRVPDREWNSYKNFYLELKQVYYNKVRNTTTCNNTCPVGVPLTITSPSPCPAITDFSIVDVSPASPCGTNSKLESISYNGGNLNTPVRVTIAYAAGIDTTGLQRTFQFAQNDSSKTFCIPLNLPSQAISVENLICSSCQANPLLYGSWTNDHIVQNLYNAAGSLISTASIPQNDTTLATGGQITINAGNTYNITGTCNPHTGIWDMDDNCLFSVYSNDVKYSLMSVTAQQLVLKHKEGTLEEIWYLNSAGTALACSNPTTLQVAGVAGSNSYFTGAYPSRHQLSIIAGTAGTQPAFNCVNSTGGSGSSVATFYTCLVVQVPGSSPMNYSNVWMFDCVYDNIPSSCAASLVTKTSRFYDNTAPLTAENTSGQAQQAQDGISSQVQTAVTGEASNWISILSPGLTGYNAAPVSALSAAFEDIAAKGGDINHPFGASSVAPGQTTASGYLNFGDAMKGILNITSFTSTLNPWLIGSPYPFSPRMQAAFSTISNSNIDICSLLQQYQSQCDSYNSANGSSLTLYNYFVQVYGAAMNISAADFAALQNSCGQCRFLLANDITLPVFLDPTSKGCVMPTEYQAAKAALQAQFSGGLPATDNNYETVYTNFMNQRWGFVLGYTDYLRYDSLLTANPATSQMLCNVIMTVPTPDPLACVESAIATGVANGDRDYLAYLEIQKNLFRASYVSTCSAARPQVNLYAPQKIYHYTLYYYDQADNLLATVPPEGVQLLTDAQIASAGTYRSQFTATDTSTVSPVYPAHRLFTTYNFNSTNQTTQQRSPDGGTNRFWYDLLSRLVISQNDVQLAAHNYSYTIFDPLGRITEVGQKNQTTVNIGNPDYQLASAISSFNAAGTNAQITDTYYDIPVTATNGMQAVTQNNLRKRVAASTYRDTQTGQVQQATYYNYDLEGNVSTLYQQVAGLGLKQIDYQYDLISGKVNFVSYQNGQADQFYYLYNYDADNRITEAWTGTSATVLPYGGNSYLNNGRMDAAYKYYLHGPMARMELGDVNGKVQGLDYAYTLQGWTKGVNRTVDYLDTTKAIDMGADGPNGVAKDAFNYNLYYYAGDYKPIGGVNPFDKVLETVKGFYPLYNGNIVGMGQTMPAINQQTVINAYKYDQLNRLTINQPFQNNLPSALVSIQAMDEQFAYDGNGNITTSARHGDYFAAAKAMDQLTYQYNLDANGKLLNNQLNYIKDKVAFQADADTHDLYTSAKNNYTYDAKGNLIGDKQSNISAITWSVYNKIQTITKTDGPNLSYTYYPDQKRASQTSNNTTSWYVRDAQGNTLAVYDNKGSNINWREQDLYGSSRIGMWTPNMNLTTNNAQTIWDTIGHKSYELTNHLGNVLATISDRRIAHSTNGTTIDFYLPITTTAQEYFAFGFAIPSRNYNLNQPYRYGFNGKENDNQVKLDFDGHAIPGSQQDYGERIYDPRLGRFLSVDPITQKYPWYTPYQFAGNTPIQAIDLDGLEPAYTEMSGRRVGARDGGLAGGGVKTRPQIKVVPAKVVREITIAMADNTGHGYIGPQSWVHAQVGAVKQQQRDQVGENIKGGPLAAIGYLAGGDKWSYAGAVGDGVMMAFGGTGVPGVFDNAPIQPDFQEVNENAVANKALVTEEALIPNAHFVSRHGAATTLQEQFTRATAGVTPDGVIGKPVNSSRFLSDKLQFEALIQAKQINSTTGQNSFTFDMNKTIGEGYLKGGNNGNVTKTSSVTAIFKNGQPLTLYPNLDKGTTSTP